jgi:triacylglycerol lipase
MLKTAPVYSLELVLHPERDTTYAHFENAASIPFQSNPSGFHRVNVWWLAEAALASYWGRSEGIAIFNAAGCNCEYLEETSTSTECYVVWQRDWLLVAFRGTQPGKWKNILTDAEVVLLPWPTGSVHAGFRRALDAIWPSLKVRLDALSTGRTVWFCGHSLGAALATLAADRYPSTRGVATFGSPRVGTPAFADSFSAKLSGKTLRYVNDQDVVTHVPPPFVGYQHVGNERAIARNGAVSFGTAAIPDSSSDLVGHTNHLLELFEGLDAGTLTIAPTLLLDHMPKAYAIWTWNDFDAHG